MDFSVPSRLSAKDANGIPFSTGFGVARYRSSLALVSHALGLLAALAAVWPPAHGQGIFRPRQSAQSGSFIDAPRSVQQQLRAAERALQEEQYSDAVVRLGDLLSLEGTFEEDLDITGQDYFLKLEK